jgi:REP element-mobilizing transposase RayT
LIEIGGVEDHIHILANVSPVLALSSFVRDVKANSAKWVNELPDRSSRFEWQKGYGAFTVSESQIEAVQKYIQNQREHHRQKSFEDEYIELLKKHRIPFQTEYLFEGEK